MTRIILVPDGETDLHMMLRAAEYVLAWGQPGGRHVGETVALESGERFAVSWPDGAVEIVRVRK